MELYQDIILQHNNAPSHYEKRPTAQHIIDAYNPLCGDKFKLFLDIENDVVTKATFHGYGCAISKASTSVLMERIQGKPLSEVLNILKTFDQIVDNSGSTEGVGDVVLHTFAIAKNYPGRDKCATLSWSALQSFLYSQD